MPKDPFYRYVDFVDNHPDKTCKYVKLAVKRFKDDLKRKDLDWRYEQGKGVVNFVENALLHWEGPLAGKPLILAPHQHFFIIQKFGWYYKTGELKGKRRFTVAYKSIARKNGKTTEECGQAIWVMVRSGVQGAQVYAVATKEEQARIVVNDAGQIISQDDEIKSRFQLSTMLGKIKSIYFPDTKSHFESWGADHNRADGFNPLMGIGDEVHAWPNAGMYNVLRSGQGARSDDFQYLVDLITTRGYIKGFCYDFEENLKKVLEGQISQDRLLGIIYTLDEDDDWEDPKNYIKANPNLNISISETYLNERMTEAVNEGGTKEVDFKTKNLNMWTDAAEVWISDSVWMGNSRGSKIEELKGSECYGGLDLAKGIDLNAFSLFFPEFNAILPFFWIPESKVSRNSDNVDYNKWVGKYMFTCKGDIIDHDQMVGDIIKVISDYKFLSLAFDPALAYHGVIQDLDNGGIECIPFGQALRNVSESTKQLETMAVGLELEHFNNPVLRWMIGNVTTYTDRNGNIGCHKGDSRGKIDGVASTINAIALWMTKRNEQILNPGIDVW